MLAADRLLEIEEKFGAAVQRIVPTELDEATLRVILYLRDGSNLRVTEQWEMGELGRYTFDNELKIGWDNAPHHTQLQRFPHHKHIERQNNLQPSEETRLEKVMKVIFGR